MSPASAARSGKQLRRCERTFDRHLLEVTARSLERVSLTIDFV
jgi:hypothetical protein